MEFYFSSNGRVSVGQFWLKWMLPVIGIYLVLGFIFSATGVMNFDAYAVGDPAPPGVFLMYLPGLILIWPSFAIGAKRLHDIGWNGWLMLLTFIPIANLVIWVVTWFVPGNQGENRYGPDPRG